MSASEDDSSHLSIRSSNYDEGDEESHSAASTSNDFGTTTAASSTAGGSKSAADQEALCCGMSAITWVRVVVLLLIAGAAAAIGATTHVLLTNQETSAFQSEFTNYAVQITNRLDSQGQNVFASVNGFVNTITSFTNTSGLSWPQITIPQFTLRASNSMKSSNGAILQTTLAPLVTRTNRAAWEAYAEANRQWMLDGPPGVSVQPQRRLLQEVPTIPPYIWKLSNGYYGTPQEQTGPGVLFGPGNYAPVWQQEPVPVNTTTNNAYVISYDLLSNPEFEPTYQTTYQNMALSLSPAMKANDIQFLMLGGKDPIVPPDAPLTVLMSPIYPSFPSSASPLTKDNLVGVLLSYFDWGSYFGNNDLLPANVDGVTVVVKSSCNNTFTYQINGGNRTSFMGYGDLHDTGYDSMMVPNSFRGGDVKGCLYTYSLYPSQTFESQYRSNVPAVFTSILVLGFLFTIFVFYCYNVIVQRRQNSVKEMADRTNAIITSLFPSNVRDRILKDAEEQAEQEVLKGKGAKTRSSNGDVEDGSKIGVGGVGGAKNKLRNFLDGEEVGGKALGKPIADLFPETTVLFADIVGFTAWSSVREPAQVFTLLETVYRAFDIIAKRRRVFKVETVGDCYVAVTGLPEPRRDHAVVMARFARDCLYKMASLTKKLEVSLGPDTGDLSMRFGLHSGPVTAGVLRGERSRFQLFGETVNVASRIESTGERHKIHISQETADLLIAAGKEQWVEQRNERIHFKGKGDLPTFWLSVRAQSSPSRGSGANSSEHSRGEDSTKGEEAEVETAAKPMSPFGDKVQRLVDWNTDVLARLLRQVVARRDASETRRIDGEVEPVLPIVRQDGSTVLDEVVEIIRLPEFDGRAARAQVDPSTIDLGENVMTQLRDYVTIIATMYRDNPFHNFEHASHVTMSVVKLLSRIVAPDSAGIDETQEGMAASLHDHTYGITSDPLTQLACVYSALIHDVDHTGVPNAQLVKEKARIAEVYKGQSVAEQNSVDVAWDLLMDPNYTELCAAIYSNDTEQKRFRQLVVNSVMATDIVDKELKSLRNARWEKAFREGPTNENPKDQTDRKATIVIEHLIQASDIAHTMQHWHIYRKWNERLFHEMYKAYKMGRAEKDPCEFWYSGEIGFFDFYIIPLAKKLKNCGVFGVSSDEYLNYATKNRKEWEVKGREVVEGMIEKYSSMFVDHEVRLDDLQDQEKQPLRSGLLSTESNVDTSDDEMMLQEVEDLSGDEDEAKKAERNGGPTAAQIQSQLARPKPSQKHFV